MLESQPPNVARTWLGADDARGRLEQIERRLAASPLDIATLFDRACFLDRLGDAEAARAAYLDVLSQDMSHAGALANLGALLFASGFTSAACTIYRQGVAANPCNVAAQVNLANVLRQAGDIDAARLHYDAALALDPACPEAHQGLSIVIDGIDDVAAAAHREKGFRKRALMTSLYRGEGPPTTVLRIVSARGGNIPTQQILDDHVFLTHTVIAEYATALPAHQLVFNAIGDADRCQMALDAAETLLAGSDAPVLNPPHRVRRTGRLACTEWLAHLPGVIAPRMALMPRDALSSMASFGPGFPVLLRAPGFHTGQHFYRADNEQSLEQAVAALPGSHVLTIEDLEARGPDGLYRKYRVMMIGGDILPLHLAISADWKVHYFTAGMQAHPDRRAEEDRFLTGMPDVLGPVAMRAVVDIQARLGLDYAGVDFALADDGRLMVFEANAAMIIALPPPDPGSGHRRAAAQRALIAATNLVHQAAISHDW